MQQNKIIIGLVLISILLSLLIFSLVSQKKADIEGETPIVDNQTVITLNKTIYSDTASIEEKTDSVATLKDISLDESIDSKERVAAGEAVVSNFFDYGTTLSSGFSEEKFSEREIFEYAKYINTLGDSDRNSLLTAYIGLRFYIDEIDEEFVLGLLHNNKRYVQEFGTTNSCGRMNKISSILYMSQKHGYNEVINQFGNYFDNFTFAFNSCREERKPIVAFMWLAALSDIGTSTEEIAKANELVAYITADTSTTAPLVQNLKRTYFADIPEPDTASIVERLISKYPDFKIYIDII